MALLGLGGLKHLPELPAFGLEVFREPEKELTIRARWRVLGAVNLGTDGPHGSPDPSKRLSKRPFTKRLTLSSTASVPLSNNSSEVYRFKSPTALFLTEHSDHLSNSSAGKYFVRIVTSEVVRRVGKCM